jgi:hypothetical protein
MPATRMGAGSATAERYAEASHTFQPVADETCLAMFLGILECRVPDSLQEANSLQRFVALRAQWH